MKEYDDQWNVKQILNWLKIKIIIEQASSNFTFTFLYNTNLVFFIEFISRLDFENNQR